MMRARLTALGLGVLALVGASAGAVSLAGESEPAVDWYSIDGGGGTSEGNDFVVRGTIGEADAGRLAGGEFSLAGGLITGGVGAAPPCPADLTGDGQVGTNDLLALLAAWGQDGGDIDGDGTTGTNDLLALLAAWGACPTA